MKFAAIDIGSNSIKLTVVDAAAGDPFAVLTRKREVVRLGHETLLKGHLGRAAILRASECIKRFRSVAESRGADKIVATATAAVREADNSAKFVKTVKQQTGIKVEVLSGIEEARLIGLAASQAFGIKGAPTLNIDIGGGSTEISIYRDGLPQSLISVKLGAVGLTERFLTSDPPPLKALENLRAAVRATLEKPARELRQFESMNVTGTSGTILAIGYALRPYSAQSTITLHELSNFNSALSAMNLADRRRVAGLTTQRAEIIVAGGLVLEGIMRTIGIESLVTCEWGLREGVIIDRLARRRALFDPPVDQARVKARVQ